MKFMEELRLPLKKKWFDMIKSGEKKAEYREIKKYWLDRFIINHDNVSYNFNQSIHMCEGINIDSLQLSGCKIKRVTFTCGYPKRNDADRIMTFDKVKIEIGYGIPKWGAKLGEKCFVITWGKRIK